MNNLKVAILAPISHSFPPNGYGPWELVAYNLAEALSQMGVDVTVFATKDAKTSAKLRYVFDTTLDKMAEKDREAANYIHAVHALSQGEEFDIIHNHLNIHPVLFSNLIKTPVVTTLHGAAIEKNNHLYYEHLKDKPFISISNMERNAFPSLNYVDTVYNGVDFSLYPLREDKGKYFVFSGRIVKEKGILSAIKVSKQTGVPLMITGVITDQNFYDTEVAPHVDNKHIKYLGNLPSTEYMDVLKEALALLFLIEWDEPFGLSALDALASGVPVIATPRGALPEMIYDPHMGSLVTHLDHVGDILHHIENIDPITCRELAKRKFSREVMAKGYLENYKKLIRP